MESKQGHPLQRQLAHLKVVSRLLGHELHTQGSSRSITLSRDQVTEIQTSIDLFIEEATKSVGGGAYSSQGQELPTAGETHLLPARN